MARTRTGRHPKPLQHNASSAFSGRLPASTGFAVETAPAVRQIDKRDGYCYGDGSKRRRQAVQHRGEDEVAHAVDWPLSDVNIQSDESVPSDDESDGSELGQGPTLVPRGRPDGAESEHEEWMDASQALDDNPHAAGMSNAEGAQGKDAPTHADQLDRLGAFVSSLPALTLKRSVPDDVPRPTKRQVLEAQSEAAGEQTTRGAFPSGARVQLDSLLGRLPERSQIALKKSLRPLQGLARPGPSNIRGPLVPPSHFRERERSERRVAYELERSELAKWDEVSGHMKGISVRSRDGKARVDFTPAVHQHVADPHLWAAQFIPSTDFERRVGSLLAQGQTSRQLRREEQKALATQPGGPRNTAACERVRREALFVEERKARRAAKIKSKSYRRSRRTEKSGTAILDSNSMADLQHLDGLDGGNRVQEALETAEISRAKSRVTLKRGSASKWAPTEDLISGLENERREAVNPVEGSDISSGPLQALVNSAKSGSNDPPRNCSHSLGLSRGVQEMKFMQSTAALPKDEVQYGSLGFRRRFEPTADAASLATTSRITQVPPGKNANAWLQPSSVLRNPRTDLSQKCSEEEHVTIDPQQALKAAPTAPSLARSNVNPRTITHQALVARAFAEDQAVLDFSQEKARQIAEDGPKEEDITLAGWGAWSGTGVRDKQKRFVKERIGTASSNRKDVALDHVIISERQNGKLAKYRARQLDFPFNSRSQHTHRMGQPIAAELQTPAQLRHSVRPSVLVTSGHVIKPTT